MRTALAIVVAVAALAVGSGSARQEYQLADSSGQLWRHADATWLRTYVSQRNAELAAAARPTSYATNGVASQKIPHVKTSWYGGNADRPVTGSSTQRPGRLHLTVIGEQADAVLAAWRASPEFAAIEEAMGDRLAVQSYKPDNPLVSEIGLVAGGEPDVVIQEASGKVLYRARSDPGVDAIAGELRRRDPKYSPGRDPGAGAERPVNYLVWGVAGILLVFLLRGRK